MADSQSESNVFSVRIVSIDYYMAPPIPDMDVCYSSFQGGKVDEVPVIRIYGSTPAGQKTCLHIHRALPYLYVPCSDFSLKAAEEADVCTHAMARAIEKALTLKGGTGSKRQHVHGCTLVRARKFYGYHSSEELFMKIHLYYPHEVARVANLLLGGAILDKNFQPHESHIPYLLQFLVDYDLYGMGLLHASMVKFRHPLPNEFISKANRLAGQFRPSAEAFTCTFANSQADSSVNVSPNPPIWTSSTVPSSWLWQFPINIGGSPDQNHHFIKRQSASEIEGDATVDDIINQQFKMYSSLSQTRSDVKMVQSLVPIWEEEYERTGLREETISSDPCKPLPDDVLKTLSQGHELENALLDLCRVARNSSSSLGTPKEAEKFVQSIRSLTDVENLIDLGDMNTQNLNGGASECSKERNANKFKSLYGFSPRPDDAIPSELKNIFPEVLPIEKGMPRSENTEPSDQLTIDKEALRLLRWLASSQAQEDLNTGDEFVHDLILSPLLKKTAIDEVLEKANLDYEHESQQECQDILDSVEGLADSEISRQRALHFSGYKHLPEVSENVVPKADGSGDDQVTGYIENPSERELNCDFERSPQKILQDKCLSPSIMHKSKKQIWGSLTSSSHQIVNEDFESPSFTDAPKETNNDTQTGSSSGDQLTSWNEDLEFKPKIIVTDLKKGTKLAGCSVRDLMRRKRCYRIEPPNHGSCNFKKILLGKEQEEITLRPKQVVFNMPMNNVEAVMPTDTPKKSLIVDHLIGAQERSCCVTSWSTNCNFPMHGEHPLLPYSSSTLEAGTVQNMQFGLHESHVDVLHGGVAPESESVIMTDLSLLNPGKEKVQESFNLMKENSTASGLYEYCEVKEEFGFSSRCLIPSLDKDIQGGFSSTKQVPEVCSENRRNLNSTTNASVLQPVNSFSVEPETEEIFSGSHGSSLKVGNTERRYVDNVEMTLSKKPPLMDWTDGMPENMAFVPAVNNQNFFVDANSSEGTFGCDFNSLDSAGKAADEIPPFFMDTGQDDKCHCEPSKSSIFPSHHETILGVPTQYQNDGSFLYLLTTVYAPPSMDCVHEWLLDLAPQHDAAGTSKEINNLSFPDILPNCGSTSHLGSLVDQSSQEDLKTIKTESNIYQTQINEPCSGETTWKGNEHIGSWQDVSQISGPDVRSKLTPLSQMGFRDPASVGAGQQLTLLSMEEDNDDVLEAFVLVRCNNGESCQRNGISGYKVIVASDERELFNNFVKIVLSFDPDILMGWEIQGSSLGFLAERAANLGIVLLNHISRLPSLETKIPSRNSATPVKGKPDDLLPETSLANSIVIEDAIIEDEWGRTHASGVHVGGRIVLNIWRLMRGEVKLNMYTIEAVAEEVLRRKIPSFPFRILTQWFSSGARARFRCIEYAIGRARLNLEIMNRLDMINRTSELARIFGIDFFSVLSRGSQYRVESMFLRLAHTQNYLATSPGNQQVASQPAMECLPLVMEPESGFYADPVVVLDFQSLYPSMIIAYNLCFSTCLGKVVPSKANTLGVSSYSPDPQIFMDVKHHVLVTPNGVMYVPSKVRRGVLPRMLEEILSTRIMVKQAMKKLLPSQQVLYRIFNARQLALKLISNVTYGYTAAGFSGRMPCAELADSIVQCGRRTLEKAISFVNSHDKWNATVIYGDTDSMFVLLKGRSMKESFRIGQEIASEITSMNPDPVTLKMEKVYYPCFLLTKKRYVGYSYESPDQAEPLFDAKGIETVRRDSCGAVAKLLGQSLRLFFEHRDVSKVKEYLQRQWTRILGGRVSLQDFVFAKEVRLGTYALCASSLPPAAIVATKAMRSDPRAEPRYAERVPYVVIHGEPGARLVDMVVNPLDLLGIDSPLRLNDLYYINKQIIPALQRVFGLVGADLNQWFFEMPRPVRPTVSKRHSYAPNAQRKRIDCYYISKHCVLCGQLVQASTHLCDECFKKGPAAATAVICRTSKLERDIQHLASICQHCGGVDWMVESGVKCTSLSCTVFYERRKVQKELQSLSAVASEVGLYPRCMVEWF